MQITCSVVTHAGSPSYFLPEGTLMHLVNISPHLCDQGTGLGIRVLPIPSPHSNSQTCAANTIRKPGLGLYLLSRQVAQSLAVGRGGPSSNEAAPTPTSPQPRGLVS